MRPKKEKLLNKTVFLTILNDMIFPLEKLVEFTGNVYEITCASIRRAYQLSMVKDPEIEENDGKVVSLAARQVFTHNVEYKIEQE